MNLIWVLHILGFTYLNGVQEIPQNGIELEPPYEPDPVVFSYNTPAWYILGICVAIIFGWILFRQYTKYKKNRYRREAIKALGEMESALEDTSPNTVLNSLRILLKQVAIYAFGRTEVAPLYGKAWLSYLDSTARDISFSAYEDLLVPSSATTQEYSEKRIKEALALSKKWIKTHARKL
jgi:hypothetical protein